MTAMKKTWMGILATFGLSIAVIGMEIPFDWPMVAYANGAASVKTLNHLQIRDTRAPMTDSRAFLQRGNDLTTLRQAYDFTPLYQLGYQGRGQTVAIVLPGVNQDEVKHDLKQLDEYYNLPPVDLSFVYPEGVKSADAYAAATAEPDIDVSFVHAFAPLAKIVCVVDASSYESFAYIENHQTANIVNFSYASPEAIDLVKHKSWMIDYDSVLQYLAAHGVSVFSGSGDWGASDTDWHLKKPSWENDPALQGKLSVNFPATDPWVTAVGGTSLFTDGLGNYVYEDAWPYSGGGYSAYFPRPDWQNGPGLPDDATHRAVPDIAFDSDLYTSLRIFYNNKLRAIGGTSVAGPTWAAITALANEANGKPLGFLNPKIYQIADSPAYKQVFHDITNGSNDYAARPGWDAVTGVGSPDVYHWVQAMTVGLGNDVPPAPPSYDLSTSTYLKTKQTTATK